MSGGRLQPRRATASDSSSPMLLASADAVRCYVRPAASGMPVSATIASAT
jgi:hypothetical protein